MIDIKKTITEAIQEAQAHEVKLVTGTWGVQWNADKKKWEFEDPYQKQCCALGAVLLKHQPEPQGFSTSGVDTMVHFLEVTDEYIANLIESFDEPRCWDLLEHPGLTKCEENPDPVRLGYELNKQFNPSPAKGEE